MLVGIEPTLGDRIVTLIAVHGPQEAAQLQYAMGGQGHRYTVQAIYYELRKLIRHGVLVKQKSNFAIRVAWALELATLNDRIRDTCFSASAGAALLPGKNCKVTWHFSNLLRLDDFWVECMQRAFDDSEGKVLYNWAPRPWFYFGQAKKLDQFYRSIARKKCRIGLVLGGDDPLDRAFSARMSRSLYTIRHDPQFLPDMGRQHLQVIGEYVFKVTISARTMRELDLIFSKTASLEKLDWGRMQRALNSSTSARLDIIHHPVQAGRLRGKFERYFGRR